MKKVNLFLSASILIFTVVFGQQYRNVEPVIVKTKDGKKINLYENSYALLIGVSDYEYWNDLPSVPAELDSVETALKNIGFEVVKKLNPNDTELEQVFEDFIDLYGYKEKNRLLFFFSGHGFTRSIGARGYLIPKNAPLPQENESELFRKALSMSQIKTWCREMIARHILFLFDSCFSGTIFTTKGEGDSLQHITDLTAKPVRQFITAGSAGEKVPARSVFTPFFVKAIQGEADLLKDGYITGTEIGLYLQKNVKQYSSTKQSPQCGKISDPEYIEGDFVFVSPLGGRIQFLRSTPDMLSESEAIRAIINHNFFDTEMNAIGKGYDNLYEVQIIRGDRVVIDNNSELIWQQSGSDKKIEFEAAKKWITELNRKGFAGFNDWRLPTLEEAMSLMESEKNSDGLYIDSKFDSTQRSIWTSDLRRASWVSWWVVHFGSGDCGSSGSFDNQIMHVRAVRSVQSSQVRKPVLMGLSFNDVTAILKEKNLFDSYLNENGKGFDNDFVLQKNGQVVYDRNSGLMWQRGGSDNYMNYGDAKLWVEQLNFAGYSDWRLPKLEEAMSLVEPEINSDCLYIDSKFDKTQQYIWTSDLVKGEPWTWVGSFSHGACGYAYFHGANYVRAVRSLQSSQVRKPAYTPPPLRNTPLPRRLSNNNVTAILKEKNLFDSYLNENGKGFDNDFVLQKNGQVVYDRNSGLMWQRGGSDNYMNYGDAKLWVEQLNFAGYSDWRLPTLEEAMSLMERETNSDGLYIDPKFDKTQRRIWTSDLVKYMPKEAWVVDFSSGYCCEDEIDFDLSVRAVRSGQTSME